MSIVPHALQCVDGCFFCILPHLTFCFWHTDFRFKFFGKLSLTRGLNIKVVGFVLKKILTYFEMLIVPRALHCVDSCIFVFTSFDTVWHTVLVSVPPPIPPLPHFFFKLLCQNSLTRELTVRFIGLPPAPFPPIFLSDLVLAPSSLHQPPTDKGHTVLEYY